MRKFYLILSLAFLFMMSCENNLEMSFPKGPQGDEGPQGEKGEDGKDGLSAFDLWKIVFEKGPDTTIEDFFDSLRGKDGDNGHTPIIGGNGNWFINGEDTNVPARGVDGATPTVGENGNWLLNGEDTGVPVAGKDGENGISPTIGENGNWYIGDTDTGVPAAGKDGVSPTVGGNGNWHIAGVDTGVKAEGIDGTNGIDGITPTIGSNGNWYIDGIDTGLPSKGNDGDNGVTPSIGANGNWFIGDVDTGFPSKGDDGVSAYNLWKEAVDAGEMTNKDGSLYTDGNTEEDFFIWLQGGNVSVLHQFWLDQGNTGDIESFIESLFTCNCSGISVAVYAPDVCVQINPNGTIAGEYEAILTVGAEAGALVEVSVGGITLSKTVPAGENQVQFNGPRIDIDVAATIVATLPSTNEQITKTVIVPALKYYKLEDVSVTQVGIEQKDIATFTLETAPAEVRINNQIIFENGAIVSGSAWVVSNGGRTFTKTYDRLENLQTLSVRASGDNGECSLLINLCNIPPIAAAGFTSIPTIAIEECDVNISIEGTAGMTVTASFNDPSNEDQPQTVVFTESPIGTYKGLLPRTYQEYEVTLHAENVGSVFTTTGQVEGVALLPTPFTYEALPFNTNNPQFTAQFTNLLNIPIEIEFSREANTNGDATEQVPWIEGSPGVNSTKTILIDALSTVAVDFNRDVAPGFASGSYTIIMNTTSQCGKSYSDTGLVVNQTGI